MFECALKGGYESIPGETTFPLYMSQNNWRCILLTVCRFPFYISSLLTSLWQAVSKRLEVFV